MKRVLLAVLVCCAAACSRKVVRVDPPVAIAPASTVAAPPARPASPTAVDEKASVEVVDAVRSLGPLVAPTVHFAYDSDIIDVPSRELLAQFAERLLAMPSPEPVTIEGHADARGSSEYNLLLGERRAARVAKYLTDFGVPRKLLRTISYGEERPLDRRQGEDAWTTNRRAQVVLPPGLATRE